VTRSCLHCGGEIPASRRSDATYCSDHCGAAASYQRRKVKIIASVRSWQAQHPDRVRGYGAASYRRHRAKRLAAQRRRYSLNKAAARERLRAWRQSNKAKYRAQQRRRYLRHQDKCRAQGRADYAKHRAARIAAVLARRTPEDRRAEGKRRYWRYHDRERLKNLRQRLKKQFGGRLPTASYVKARELWLMVCWEDAAARKAARL
jgi:hypothetical protein